MQNSSRRDALLFLWWPWFVLFCVVVFSALFPAAAKNVGFWALLGSALLFGLPHGACDLWAIGQALKNDVEAQSSTRWQRAWRLGKWILAYIGAAIVTLSAWKFSSAWALLGFLLLSVWHFGSADAWLHRLNSGIAPTTNAPNERTRLAFFALSWGRGLLVISAPLALQPRATQEILGAFARLSGAPADIAVLWTIAPFLLLSGAALQLLVCFLLRSDSTENSPTSARSLVGSGALWLETLWLLILFAVAPPLLAVSCYFIGLHSWRHVLRLELFADSDAPQKARDWRSDMRDSLVFARRAVVQQHRHGLLLGIASLLGLVPILLWWPSLLGDVSRWNTAYLVLISAVTVPHATVIAWLEARHNL